jgi:hypothetical protein
MNIQAIAKTISEQFNYDRESALAALREKVSADPEMMQEAALQWCVHAVATAASDQRRSFFEGRGPRVPAPTPVSSKEQLAALEKALLQNWFAIQMPGGKALGDCTHEDLDFAYSVWAAQAEYNARRAAWCQELKGLCKRGKTMGDSTTVEKIDQVSKKNRIDLREAS